MEENFIVEIMAADGFMLAKCYVENISVAVDIAKKWSYFDVIDGRTGEVLFHKKGEIHWSIFD